LGIGKEAVFGTPVLPTQFVPFSENTIERDPGLFYPSLMTGSRDSQIFPVYGQEKDNGSIGAPLFPTNGILALIAAIGADGQPGYGVTGSPGGSVNTTLSAGVSPGATTITVASATGIVAGFTVLQIDTNNTSQPFTSECRLVTNVSGTTITLSSALVYSHGSGVAVKSVIAPYTHTIVQQSILPSLTIEKNIGGYQSLQFGGCRMNKYSIKGQATDTEATFTADVVAQSYAILNTPSALSIIDELPFVFAEFVLTWDGPTLAQATNFSLDIDNMLKPTWTMNGNHELQFNPATGLHVNGSFDTVWDSLNDPVYGYFQDITNGTEGALSFTLSHPGTAGSIVVNMGNVRLSKNQIPPKMNDLIMETINFEARRSLSASPSVTIGATITNNTYTAF
jgi:hypothetical protein